MLWLLGAVLVVLIVVGALASLGKFGHSRKRFDLPGGGTVEYADVIVGKTLLYTDGNRFQKLMQQMPEFIRSALPAGWLTGGTMSVGNSGSGIAAGLVLKQKNAAPSQNVYLQIGDDAGWSTTGKGLVGVLENTPNERFCIYNLGILPHSAPELKVRLFTGSWSSTKGGNGEAVGEFTVRNPLFNSPPISSVKSPPLKRESTDGELTLRVLSALTNISSAGDGATSNSGSRIVRAAKGEANACTLLKIQTYEKGQPTTDYRVDFATIFDAFGAEQRCGITVTTDTSTVHEFTLKLPTNLPLDGLPYKFVLNFYHDRNFTQAELYTLEQALPTTATASEIVSSSSAMGKLDVYTGGPGYIDPQITRAKVASDEYGVYALTEAKLFTDYQLKLQRADIPGPVQLEPGMRASQYISGRPTLSKATAGMGSMLYYWKIRPKFEQTWSLDRPTSVGLTFSIAKMRKMEVVLKVEQPGE
jgi:hypothetical protein